MTLPRLIVVLTFACEAEAPPVEPPPDPVPERDVIGEPLDVYAHRIGPPASFASAIDGGFLLQAGAELHLVTSSTVANLGDRAGTLRGVASIDGRVAIAGSEGLFVLDGALVESPLSSEIGEPTDFFPIEGGALIGTAEGLYLYRGGRLSAIAPPFAGARAWPGSGGAVWVASDRLYRLDLGSSPAAHPETLDGAVVDLAIAGDRVFAVAGDRLHSRTPTSPWRTHDAVEGVRAVRAIGGVVFVEGSVLSVVRDGVFHTVRGGPFGSLLAASPDGMILSGDADTSEVFLELRVFATGIEAGELVREPRTVAIDALLPERVVRFEASLDGSPLSVVDGSVGIDPTALDDGSHDLSIAAIYDTLPEARATIRFSVYQGPPPAWSTDVAGVFEARCAVCHGRGGSAHLMATSEAWIAEIDAIIDNVRSGRMPLPPNPPLDAAEVELIEGWQAAGFPD